MPAALLLVTSCSLVHHSLKTLSAAFDKELMAACRRRGLKCKRAEVNGTASGDFDGPAIRAMGLAKVRPCCVLFGGEVSSEGARSKPLACC